MSGKDVVTLLLLTRVQGSCINVMHSAIGPHGAHPRQEEVAMSLEAVCGAVQVQGRPWQMQRKRRRDGVPQHLVSHYTLPNLSCHTVTPMLLFCPRSHPKADCYRRDLILK